MQTVILLVVSYKVLAAVFFDRPGWRRRKCWLVLLLVNVSFSRARQYNSQTASNCFPTSKQTCATVFWCNLETFPLGCVRLRRLEQRMLNVPLHPSARGTISMQVNNINKTGETYCMIRWEKQKRVGKEAAQLRTEKKLFQVDLTRLELWQKKSCPTRPGSNNRSRRTYPTRTVQCLYERKKNEKKCEQKEALWKIENKLQTKKSYQRQTEADCLGFELVRLSFGRISLLPATQTGVRVRPHRGVGMRQCFLWCFLSRFRFSLPKGSRLPQDPFLLNSKQGESCLLHFDFPIGALNSLFVPPRI